MLSPLPREKRKTEFFSARRAEARDVFATAMISGIDRPSSKIDLFGFSEEPEDERPVFSTVPGTRLWLYVERPESITSSDSKKAHSRLT